MRYHFFEWTKGARGITKDMNGYAEYLMEDELAESTKEIYLQKAELGRLKEAIVKWSNAYIYYSMLKQKIEKLDGQFVLEHDFCENVEKAAITQKELEELLELWKQNKSDSEAVYKILERMFELPRTKCFGKDIGEDFDDSSYVRSHFEKIRGLHIQSGYIVDGIRPLYERNVQNQTHGGTGGSEHIIIFEEGDELQRITGHFAVPFMVPTGDVHLR